jgi:predicted AlkP superfamily pyrophosphatase or phosphodiesterase
LGSKPRSETIKVPTLFDAAKKKGMTTAAFIWPQTRADASVDFNILSPLPGEEPNPAMVQLREAGVPIHLYFDWAKDTHLRNARDIVLAQAAAHIIREHKPNFIAFHILATDGLQHAHGPDHYQAKTALTTADHCVGLLREAVKEAGIADRTTFIIAADHGFHSVHHQVNIYPVIKESGLEDRINFHGSGWTTFVELTPKFNAQRDGPALEKFFDNLMRVDGVHRIIRPEQFHSLGWPRYEEDPHVRGQYMIISDIDTHLVRQPDYPSTQRRPRPTPSHGHGYLPYHPRMYPMLILSGHRIKQGVTLGHVHNLDVAPTIAHILGLEMPKMEGRVLKEALRD